jgi:hypothetical protein
VLEHLLCSVTLGVELAVVIGPPALFPCCKVGFDGVGAMFQRGVDTIGGEGAVGDEVEWFGHCDRCDGNIGEAGLMVVCKYITETKIFQDQYSIYSYQM